MARLHFGGAGAIYVAGPDGKTMQLAITGATGMVYDARTGGNKYVDLQNLDGTPISGGNIVTTDQSIPEWLGPDGVSQMWLSWNGAKRELIQGTLLGGGSPGVGAPSANTALFVRKAAAVAPATDGVWPARPTSDGSIMVFWDGPPNADGSGPPTVTTGTGGMRAGDKWLSHP